MPSLNPIPIDDASWKHGNVFLDDAQEVRIHYIDCPPYPDKPDRTEETNTILLIHGFPNTSYQWRHVITPLAKAGYRVIAPDYRGAGESSHPANGFDKLTIATDLHKLLHDHLNIKKSIHVVGHDIGGMIAHAYAAKFPDHTLSVTWGECPLPGSTPYESGFKNSPGMWHFTFHQQTDLPEALVAGRERIYLKHFYDRLCVNPAAITPADLDHYVTSFAQPGGMRCGFELYRAFPRDARDNRRMLEERGRSKVPACSLSGEGSLLLQVAEEQTREFYESVEVATVEGSGHWCAEENPGGLVRKVMEFVGKYDKS
ncbi:alpha/beta-Hydrolase [Glarea lozoyensis ATCC 20868]|uniref:Alpha/beta-Hydrolase n=1 Tax=Glarea lozoyensis (strain ATCC 20868 / MF5171) TaxID=1116229 RepID=S3CY91_GLAL2|nr:alpha/beta-Hydrolase [Glarea lozoyensis ATCC 20868]EPE24766.1 alpha/beta-Hydrolase [Glarea lozoyensis ATCC 20868]